MLQSNNSVCSLEALPHLHQIMETEMKTVQGVGMRIMSPAQRLAPLSF